MPPPPYFDFRWAALSLLCTRCRAQEDDDGIEIQRSEVVIVLWFITGFIFMLGFLFACACSSLRSSRGRRLLQIRDQNQPEPAEPASEAEEEPEAEAEEEEPEAQEAAPEQEGGEDANPWAGLAPLGQEELAALRRDLEARMAAWRAEQQPPPLPPPGPPPAPPGPPPAPPGPPPAPPPTPGNPQPQPTRWEMCQHPEEAIMRTIRADRGGNQSLRLRCLDCDMVVFEGPYTGRCQHQAFDRRGTNQFGPRLRCLDCDLLLLRNVNGTARHLPRYD